LRHPWNLAFRTPAPSADVRIDTGFATGDGFRHRAMLAKLICRGATRDEALRTLRRALVTDVVGVASNLDLLGRIAASGVYRRRCGHRVHCAPRRHVARAAARAIDRGVGGCRAVRADR
jgi:acetyl/propionyl-CoA carboxylase alpha subunit